MNYREFKQIVERITNEELYHKLPSERTAKVFESIVAFMLKKKQNKKVTLFTEYSDKVVEILQLIERNNSVLASDLLYNLYFNDSLISQKTKQLNADLKFYKARPSTQNIDYVLDDENGMGHIPFEKRDYIGNNRYSDDGVPCLYLGNSTYICWEETNRPDINKSNFAMFLSKCQLYFLNLCLPSENSVLETVNIAFLPLIIACRLRKSTETFEAKSHLEYKLPQMVMGCLMKYKHLNPQCRIDGIMYTSVHMESKGFMFDKRTRRQKCTNFVIPPVCYPSEGVCPIIQSKFKLAGCTSWECILIRRPAAGSSSGVQSYSSSIFGLLEKELSDIYKIKNNGMLTY